jgi:hypothetical protein
MVRATVGNQKHRLAFGVMACDVALGSRQAGSWEAIGDVALSAFWRASVIISGHFIEYYNRPKKGWMSAEKRAVEGGTSDS